jgi:PPIC-type PPIASE domain
LSKLLRINNLIILIVSAAALITGCGKETPHRDFIAKVNNTYLSKEDLQTIIDSVPGNSQFRSEIIRNWINRECLYQQAVKEGILKSGEYQKIIEDSKKELASALMLKKFYEDKEPSIDENGVRAYFESHKDLFKLNNEAYFLNRINFANEEKAIQFRTTVIESNWNKASNVFKKDASSIILNTLIDGPEIHPAALLRIVEVLDPKEISIVVNTDNNIYSVIQLIDRYQKGTIPPFDIIKDKVSKMYVSFKKEILFNDYLEKLYFQNDIEIKK